MMELRGLHKTFNPGTPIENPALRGVSLNIAAGEFVTVIGSNGSGKSTTLNAISGDLMVDDGQIVIDGRDVTKLNAWQRAGLVARVFQDPMAGTCEALSIEENLALAWQRGQRRGLGRAVRPELRTLFRERLAHLNLGLENRLDEHTAALDPKTAAFVLRLTDQIVAENQLTTLMVTHSMRQALDHGTRTVMLHQGQVVLDVSGEERARMDVPDLLAMFERTRGEKVSDDALLLG